MYPGSSLSSWEQVPQSDLRTGLPGLSPQKVHQIKHNSQLLGCAFVCLFVFFVNTTLCWVSVLWSSAIKMDRIQHLALRNSPSRGGDSKDNGVGCDMMEGRKPRGRSGEARHLIDLRHQRRFLEGSEGGEFQDES